jgi:mRNA-degrading endonuclease RelE of RelBE toxin-antitoxin system
MDKITKALKKLTQKEKQKLKQILSKIKTGNFKELDLKKLKAKSSIYRVRFGKLRLIFQNDKNTIKILTIERRNDNTYNLD